MFAGLCAGIADFMFKRLLFGMLKGVNNNVLLYVTFLVAVILIDVFVVMVVVRVMMMVIAVIRGVL